VCVCLCVCVFVYVCMYMYVYEYIYTHTLSPARASSLSLSHLLYIYNVYIYTLPPTPNHPPSPPPTHLHTYTQISLAVQHYGMLPLTRNIHELTTGLPKMLASHASHLPSHSLPSIPKNNSIVKGLVTGVTGLIAAVVGDGQLNRSATADPHAGARCVGYAAVANKDLAGWV
jgi:hypothetical protein